MAVLKGLALSLLSFLLFLSLTLFGFAFILNSTLLNPNFITSELDKLDVSTITEELVTQQMTDQEMPFPEEVLSALTDAIPNLVSVINEQLNTALNDIYDYLLGKKDQPDLKTTLGNTFLNSEFLSSVLDELDLSLLVEQALQEQEGEEGGFPEELMTALIDTINELEPTLKENIAAVADPIFKYLLDEEEQPGMRTALGDTFLNSDFVNSLLDELDLASLVEQLMEGQTDVIYEEFITALVDTINEHETELKQNVAAATDPIFDYLLGETQDIDLALTLRNTVLSSDFVLSLIDKLAIYFMASEALGGTFTEQIPEEMEFLTEYLDDLMPEVASTIKQQIRDNVDQLLDYLLGQRESISIVISLGSITETLEDSLKEHLREMSPAELEPYIEQIVTEQITAIVPAELQHLVDQAITDEWVTQQANTAADPVLRYLLGDSPGLNVTITLAPIVENMREPVKQEFLESPPPELAAIPESLLEQYFDDYFEELTQDIPSSIVIDDSMLGADLPSQIDSLFQDLAQAMPTSFNIGEILTEAIPSNMITDALHEAEGGLGEARESIADAEDQLGEVRQDVDEAIADFENTFEEPLLGGSSLRQIIGYFQLGYKIAIALIAVLALGIILIHRQVKGATRGLGVTFLTYGLINYVSIILGKNIGGPRITDLVSRGDINIPQSLQELPMQFVNAFTSPLQTFSLIVLIVGAVLVVTSFVYPRLRPSAAEDE